MIVSGVLRERMTAPELEKLLIDLRTFCAGRGRQAQVAEELKVSRGLVHDWITGRRTPSVDHFFALQAFLKKQRRRR